MSEKKTSKKIKFNAVQRQLAHFIVSFTNIFDDDAKLKLTDMLIDDKQKYYIQVLGNFYQLNQEIQDQVVGQFKIHMREAMERKLNEKNNENNEKTIDTEK